MGKTQLIAVVILSAILTRSLSQDQISWTPIYVDTTDRLDLWTISSTGCQCPDGGGSGSERGCACCAQPGGCLCSFNHNKCAQCGLEDVCSRFCNVSISSRAIAARSGLSWLEIKSPELEGGGQSCWWKLHSAPGQRIEVQIHRILNIGVYNNNTLTCSGGFLQFSDGEMYNPTRQAIQMCAPNARFSPPVTFFGDQGIATLLVRTESKSRSTLLAYVSFSSADDPVIGVARKGGRLRPNSACDWIYENCFDECVIVSPGYPGLIKPNRKCYYFLNANSTTDKIRITFTTLSLPPKSHCGSHHVAIWRRNVSLSQSWGSPWKTLCQESEKELSLEIDGGAGVIEFRSGATLFPYIFRGFRAVVSFIHSPLQIPPTAPSITKVPLRGRPSKRQPTKRPQYTNDYDDEEEEDEYEDSIEEFSSQPYDLNGVHQISCGHVFDGSIVRGSVFRLIIPKELTERRHGKHHFHTKSPGSPLIQCHLEFRGKKNDVVQLAVFKYRFSGPSCSSYLEVYDLFDDPSSNGNVTAENRLLGKLCGPTGNEVKRFTSSHSRLALLTSAPSTTTLPLPLGTEYLDGAFRFHDETIEGTVKPMSSCEVVYYGVTSAPTGSLLGPPDSPLLRLSTFPLLCAYSFLPAGRGHTVALTLQRAGHQTSSASMPGSKAYCRTFCGGSGCACEAKYALLKDIDHILVVAGASRTPISCLCGFITDALPMTFESEDSLSLVYHATHVGFSGFSYAADFAFRRKVLCSNFSVSPPSGSVRWREALGPGVTSFLQSSSPSSSSVYTLFQCAWDVEIPQRYNLSIHFSSEENEKDCNAWNLTLWIGGAMTPPPENNKRNLIASFCPKEGRMEAKVPETVRKAHIRLIGVTLRPPQFEIKWRYSDLLLPDLVTKEVSSGRSDPLPPQLITNFLLFSCVMILSLLIGS